MHCIVVSDVNVSKICMSPIISSISQKFSQFQYSLLLEAIFCFIFVQLYLSFSVCRHWCKYRVLMQMILTQMEEDSSCLQHYPKDRSNIQAKQRSGEAPMITECMFSPMMSINGGRLKKPLLWVKVFIFKQILFGDLKFR